MGNKITDSSEVLFRQVHPQFYQNGVLGSRAFKPNSSDNGFMSTDRASMTSAKDAHEHYTVHLKKQSACVFGVTVAEFSSEKVECSEDPLAADGDTPANPAHCLADYNAHDEKSWKNIAQKLKVVAEKRGCQFP